MNSKQKKVLIFEVENELKQIDNDIAYLKEATKPVSPENAIGRISRMDAINNMNINKSLLKSKEQLKINLEQVLTQVDQPDFGICTRCKEMIPYKRIIRVPDSKMCVPCIREINQK
jgi:DnaK suppressor protein